MAGDFEIAFELGRSETHVLEAIAAVCGRGIETLAVVTDA